MPVSDYDPNTYIIFKVIKRVWTGVLVREYAHIFTPGHASVGTYLCVCRYTNKYTQTYT